MNNLTQLQAKINVPDLRFITPNVVLPLLAEPNHNLEIYNIEEDSKSLAKVPI